MVDAISRSKTFETLSGAVYGDIKITYAGPGIIKFETTKTNTGRQAVHRICKRNSLKSQRNLRNCLFIVILGGAEYEKEKLLF